MARSTAARIAIGSGWIALADYASMHTSDPGSTGAGEATGGTPAYARKPITWTDNGDGTWTSNALVFDIPAGSFTHLGFFSAATAGTFLEGVEAPVTATEQSTFTIIVTVEVL